MEPKQQDKLLDYHGLDFKAYKRRCLVKKQKPQKKVHLSFLLTWDGDMNPKWYPWSPSLGANERIHEYLNDNQMRTFIPQKYTYPRNHPEEIARRLKQKNERKLEKNVSFCSRIAVLVRDVAQDGENVEYLPQMWECCKRLLGDRLVGFWTIEDLRDLSAIRKRRAVDSLRLRVDTILGDVKHEKFPAAEQLAKACNANASSSRSTLGNNALQKIEPHASLGVELHRIVTAEMVNGKLCSLIFPATQCENATAKLLKQDRELSKREAAAQESNSFVPNLEVEFANLAKKKHQIEDHAKRFDFSKMNLREWICFVLVTSFLEFQRLHKTGVFLRHRLQKLLLKRFVAENGSDFVVNGCQTILGRVLLQPTYTEFVRYVGDVVGGAC